jgi:L-ascorbate metabolism protein UlaG (beta-lactamase superfamily)
MRRWRRIGAKSAAAAVLLAAAAFAEVPMSDLEKLYAAPLAGQDAAVMFLSFSAVLVRTAEGTVAVDPSNLLTAGDIAILKRNGLKAVLYTHGHGDHLDAATAKALVRETGAVVVAEPAVAASLKAVLPADKLVAAVDGKDVQAAGLTVRGFAGKHVGPIMLYRVQWGPVSFFHGGDSDYVPLPGGRADLAILPTGAPSPTASPEAALKMALDVKPRAAVLVHGSEAQNAAFKKLAAARLPEMKVIAPAHFAVVTVSLR